MTSARAFFVKQEPLSDPEGVEMAPHPDHGVTLEDGGDNNSDLVNNGDFNDVVSDDERCSTVERTRVKCGICHEVVANRTSLHKHMRMHFGKKPYQCSWCLRRSHQKEHRDKHTHIHATQVQVEAAAAASSHKPPAAAATYCCYVCRKLFTKRYNLHRHMRSQHGESSNMCQYCGKSFKRSSETQTHELTPWGERLHQCPVCGRCFRHQHDMMTHQLVHVSKVNVVRPVCNRGFNYASSFFEHMAAHDAEEKKEEMLSMAAKEAGDAEEDQGQGTPTHEQLVEALQDSEDICRQSGYGEDDQVGEVAIKVSPLSTSPQQARSFQEGYIAKEDLVADCMFCGKLFMEPCELCDHLLEHCREIQDNGWRSEDDVDEILGL